MKKNLKFMSNLLSKNQEDAREDGENKLSVVKQLNE